MAGVDALSVALRICRRILATCRELNKQNNKNRRQAPFISYACEANCAPDIRPRVKKCRSFIRQFVGCSEGSTSAPQQLGLSSSFSLPMRPTNLYSVVQHSIKTMKIGTQTPPTTNWFPYHFALFISTNFRTNSL